MFTVYPKVRLTDEQKLTRLSFMYNVVGLIIGLIVIAWVEDDKLPEHIIVSMKFIELI